MKLCELFGPTVQGEGPHAGQRVGFIRFAECNLACSWCDTPYSWDWTRYDREAETFHMVPEDVAERVHAMDVRRVVLTGGEPMIQQKHFPALHRAMTDSVLIDVETNGTITPHPSIEPVVDLFCVSPKLAHSGDTEHKRLKDGALTRYGELAVRGKAIFKWVVQTPADIAAVTALSQRYEVPRSAVWLMPEGRTREEHLSTLETLADQIVQSGFNLSTRLHVLAWGDKRGV